MSASPQVVVVWQCSENPSHRGWRDESRPSEQLRRGTCDICLAMTAFERPTVIDLEAARGRKGA